MFAVIEGPDLGWWTPKSDLTIFGWVWSKDAAVSAVPVAFGIAAVALVLFVIWERHREKVQRAALLDLGLFSFSTFSWGGNLTAAMVAVGEFAIIFVLPLYLINALDLDVMGAGLVLAAMAVGAFLSGAAARHLAAKFGSTGTVLIGLGLEVTGVLALALLLGARDSRLAHRDPPPHRLRPRPRARLRTAHRHRPPRHPPRRYLRPGIGHAEHRPANRFRPWHRVRRSDALDLPRAHSPPPLSVTRGAHRCGGGLACGRHPAIGGHHNHATP